MLQTVMLLRHAKAVPWGYDSNDFERQLAPRGRRQMQALSEWFNENLQLPELILCSSAARTVETLEVFLAAISQPPPNVEYRRSLYHASTGDLHHQLDEALKQYHSVLMVGHNPGFENLALGLADRNSAAVMQRMATGTLGVFDFGEGFASGKAVAPLHWVTRKDLSVN